MKNSWAQLMVGAVALCAVLVLAYLLVDPGATWLAGGTLQGLDPTDKATALNNSRTALTTAIGVLGTVLVAALAVPKFLEEKAKQAVDRFNAAVDHVISSSATGRVGGVWALDLIMDNSPHNRIGARKVLTQLVQEFSPRTESVSAPADQAQPKLAGDVAAAVTVASKKRKQSRRYPTAPLDLRRTYLAGADLVDAELDGALLGHTDVTEGNLDRSTLTGADLTRALFIDATLRQARCRKAVFVHTCLLRADLTAADLGDADLTDADLTGAVFVGTVLTGATLTRTHLEGADLSQSRGLTTTQLEKAFIDPSTQLPPDVLRPGSGPARR